MVATRWSLEQAQAWGQKQPWWFGANFIPSTAINQLEMWQAESFDPATIERELGYAQGIGMNLMRVYLHDLLWEADRHGLIERMERYLEIAAAKSIRTMFVLFDDCWNGGAKLGPQPAPVPGVHNSGWLQSPGHVIADSPSEWPRLERYVTELLTHFKDDRRIAVWDLYNEPGNGAAGDHEAVAGIRGTKSLPLLKAAFEWARSVSGLTQPLTAAPWTENETMNGYMLEHSDIITFHAYGPPQALSEKIASLQSLQRPMLCTEYLARPLGSTFEFCTPLLKKHGVGAINWGLVAGKTQTIEPWASLKEKADSGLYFHDIFHPDGNYLYPYEEMLIRQLGS